MAEMPVQVVQVVQAVLVQVVSVLGETVPVVLDQVALAVVFAYFEHVLEEPV